MGLFTTNAPVAKFARPGDTVEGEITDVYRAQRFEYARGQVGLPLYWSNNKPTAGARIDGATGQLNDPVLQTVITLDTGQPDADGDPERRVFVKNKRMEEALKRAVMAAGGRRIGGLLLGGRLRCTYVGDDTESDAPVPPKIIEFAYTPPAPGTGREPSGEVRLADQPGDMPVRTAPAVQQAHEARSTGSYAPPAQSAPRDLDHQRSLRDAVDSRRHRASSPVDDEPPF